MQRICSVVSAIAMTVLLCSAPAGAQASTTPTQTAGSIEQKCSADWAACSAQERLQIAQGICGSEWDSAWKENDLKKNGYDKLSRRDFYAKVSATCEPDDNVVAASQAPTTVAGNTYIDGRVTIGSGRQPYRSFENVARDSRSVRTSTGKRYDLGNLVGNSSTINSCSKWVRTEKCFPSPAGRGGIRCEMVCGD